MTPDALLFDLDGLLVDTERYSKQAFEETANDFKLGDQTDFFLSLVGTNEETHANRMQETLGHLIDVIAFRKNWIDRFHQHLDENSISALPGVIDVLTFARDAKIKCAVATSSGTDAAAGKIDEAGLSEFFITVTCGDQVQNSKPFPEIYLKAGASVNADMSRSVGLEDSANGVKAAHAAGLSVVQVPNLVPPSIELLTIGHTVCKDMYEVLALLENDKLLG